MRKQVFLFLLCCFFPLSSLAESLEWMNTEDRYSEWLYVSGRGEMRYYAQNDPRWGMMHFRYPHHQVSPTFSGTGCVPSALANCIANLVSREKLIALDAYSQGEGFFICPCSMNSLECSRMHERYRLQTTSDYERFLSLAIGSYISGNNPELQYACGTLYMLDELAAIYGLRYQRVDDLHRAADIVRNQQALAIFLVGGEDCPFTQNGHALVLCYADDQEYYFLDSYFRLNYEFDRMRIVRIIEPGLVAVRRDKISRLGANSIYVIWPEN